jgi:NAD(P)-dependent dehydrogenase (short-subunit alcohol dehydrogenase family)
MSLPSFLYSQLIQTLPYPKASFAGKSVIVTGSNVGLGKEAARHMVRLGASPLILAVRSLEKGNAAKEDIERSTGCAKGTIRVWELDMANYGSVQKFATRAERELERVDILLANAGIASFEFTRAEGNEKMITVNVVSTFLLTLLMMPKLKETAKEFNTRPVVTITSSEVHGHTDFPEKSSPPGQIFQTLNDESKADMNSRYPVSKLLEVFGVRAFADRYPSSSFPITLNTVNPGMCHS